MKQWQYENDQWTKLPTHLRHLPIITRHFDYASFAIRTIWYLFLRHFFLKFYVRLKVVGDFKEIHKNNPKLLIMSNHTSHLDAVSIAAAIPLRFWPDLYIAAAKDYFFPNFWMSFFSKHCIGAIPIDRADRKGEAVRTCMTLLEQLDRIWLVMFPEGTRSTDGKVHMFKRGISLFSKHTETPMLFLYIDGAYELWPKKMKFGKPGALTVHVGPVHPPAETEEIYASYRAWVESFKPGTFA